MAAKCTTYHVKSTELNVFIVTQTSSLQDEEDSAQSADSDIFGNLKSDQPLEVIYSDLDQAFHCQC